MDKPNAVEFLSSISGLIDKDMFNKMVNDSINEIKNEELDESDIVNDDGIISMLPNIEIDLDDNDIYNLSNLKTFYYLQSGDDVVTAYELLIEDLYRENKSLKLKQEKTDTIMNNLQELFPSDDDVFENIWHGETLESALTKIYNVVFDG